MYPNQTIPESDNSLNISQDSFLKSIDVTKSFLVFHNFGSKISEYLELEMPYMIMYETLDISTRRCAFFEFTEAKKNLGFSTLEELDKKMGTRPLHSHDFYELTFVISGNISLQIEDEIISYRAGECCLCNKNIHHREIMDSDYEIILFLFKEEYLTEMLGSDLQYDESGNVYRKDVFFHRLFADNRSQILYDAKEYIDFRLNKSFDSNKILPLLNSMICEISSNNAGKSYMMKALLCQFISVLEDDSQYSVNVHWAKLSNEETILYKISQICEKYNGRLSRKILEDETGYNADYINRIVKKRTGKTLTQYSRSILLTIAAERIVHSKDNISKICEDLGYTNRHFFNKIFEEHYGRTPYAYRKEKQQKTESQQKR